MENCRAWIYSNDFYDFIVPYGVDMEPRTGTNADCVPKISDDYDILFFPRESLASLSIENYTYTSIPKCYGLLDTTALNASGILRLQKQPVLSLKGTGVLVGFVDTGIDYTNPLFCYADGNTRILRIWDQSLQEGMPPEGVLYGTEYTEKEINLALSSPDPYSVVPSTDTDGHGTFLAGIACGSENIPNNFVGAAPNARLAVVKLKEAKQYLRDFFFIPDHVAAYQETDIMMAVSYLDRLAAAVGMPLVICIALGNSLGPHGKDGPLSSYLNYICLRRWRSVVTAAGNEAAARHHFQGQISRETGYEDIEISVDENVKGFTMELWAEAPELYAVSISAPTGEHLPRIPLRAGHSGDFYFVFAGTRVSVDYNFESLESASQLVFFRFSAPLRGLWTIRVYPEITVTGTYHLWLPLEQFTDGNVIFLRSNPDVTITSPATSSQVITVGGYRASDQSIYADSGRGYTTGGEIKPDFTAPAIDIYGPGLRGDFIRLTGTSASAAVTAGAVAQLMQWGLVEQRNPSLSNAAIKNILIRGTATSGSRSYPNREWGYGALDIYHSFELLSGG